MRNNESGFTAHELSVVIVGIGMIGCAIFALYALVHFIVKFW